MNELSLTPSQSHSIMFAIYISFKITVMILYVQEVVTPFYVVSYHIKWVTTSWTCSTCLQNIKCIYAMVLLIEVPWSMLNLFTFESFSVRHSLCQSDMGVTFLHFDSYYNIRLKLCTEFFCYELKYTRSWNCFWNIFYNYN